MSDRLELVVLLLEALDAACTELAQLAETPVPLPDRIRTQLEEHDALAATLKRMVEQAGVRDAAQAIYREELAKVTRTDDGGHVPVLPEVTSRLADVREVLRRAALLDDELAGALDDALLRSTFAG